MFPKTHMKRLPADHQIIKRRVEEERRAVLEASRAQNERYGNQASWEVKTTDRIAKHQTAARAEELRHLHSQALHRRRQKLAALLEYEKKQYEEEFQNSFETPEQRRVRMTQRAKMLKEAREKKRREVADLCLKQRSRLAQDEMRLEQSRLRTFKVARERVSQFEERRQQEAESKIEEKKFAKMWEENRQEKLKREELEREEELKRNRQMKQILDSQVSDKMRRLDLQKQELEVERRKMRAQWQREEEAESDAISKKLEDQKIARKRVQEVNLVRASQREELLQRERDIDKYLLEIQLEKDKLHDEYQRNERERMRREQREFQLHLKEQAIKEKFDDSNLEAQRREEQEKEWRKREAKWKKEEDERLALWQDVDQTRQQQIKQRQIMAARELETNRQWIESQKQKEALEDALEKEKVSNERRRRQKDQELLLVQIAEKQRKQDIEKQQEYLLEKRAARFNEDFEEQIKQLRKEVQESDILDNFPRKTMRWT